MSEERTKRTVSLPEDERKRIIDAISRHATLPCSRCGGTKFTLVEGYAFLSLSESPTAITFGGVGVPLVVIACDRCGAVYMHAAISLGLVDSARGVK